MEYRDITSQVVDYIKEKYGSEPEFLWSSTPGNAAFRHRSSKKWFAALLLDLPGSVLKLPDVARVDVLNLKCDPLLIGSLVDGKHYLPGYHMNKEHWISVLLDGRAPLREIFSLVDMSYGLIDKKKT